MMRSFIACSSAAWVLGGVRLISSASSIWVKIGPLVNTKPLVWKLNRLVPSTSPGIRSGVNWMRPNCRCRPAANARVIMVLAVPGTPSSRMWPPTRRLVSIMSMTASWPTTALRTSPRTRSVIARMSCTSIEHFPLPTVSLAGEPHQRRLVPAAGRTQFPRLLQQRGAIDADAARSADPFEPGHQRVARKRARRMQLARHVPQRLLDIAADHHLLMTGELDQLGHVLQQAGAPRAQRWRGRLRRAQAPQRCPQQKSHSDQPLDGCDHEWKAEQECEWILGRRGIAMNGLVEDDRSVRSAQPLDKRDRERRVALAREAMVGDHIRIREHQDPAIAFDQLAHQHALIAGDDRPQAGTAHELGGLHDIGPEIELIGGPENRSIL